MDKSDKYNIHGLSEMLRKCIYCQEIRLGKILLSRDKVLITNEMNDFLKGCKFLSND